jgi:hypothetical protein
LPGILPELNGDAEWRRIIADSRPSQSLNQLVERIDAQMRKGPEVFPEIKDSDFDRNS